MDKPIHLSVPTFAVDECLAEIRECLEKGWTGLGYKTVEFEEAWKAYTGLPHAHFLNSATAGLQMALRLFREHDCWREGDEVITTPLTFVSTNHVILAEGLVPVFVDVDEYLCMDPAAMDQAMTERTRAVMFVGMGGNVGRLADIAKFSTRLILDAAHMAGTRIGVDYLALAWRGNSPVEWEHVGNEVDAAVFSYQATKNLPTADAGMLCLADPELDTEARRLSWLGIDKDTYTRTNTAGDGYKWEYDVTSCGFKAHGNSIMAAIALVQLKHLDADNSRRREIAAMYDELLGDCEQIRRVPMAPDCEPSRHLYQVRVQNRDAVALKLHEQQIFPGVHYKLNTDYAMYAKYKRHPLPNAERAAAELLSLPMHLRLTESDVVRVAMELRRAVDNV